MVALTTFLFSVLSLALIALSVPVKLRDVVDPPITAPTANTVWHVGETQLVTWNTTDLSLVNATNPVGMLVLGYMYNNSENLMLNAPLATNINYTLGQVQITVPNVDTREDYIVVLFGDSGNASPEFTIINDDSSTSLPSSTSSQLVTATLSNTPSATQAHTSTLGTNSTAGTTTSTLVSVSHVATSTTAPTQSTLTSAAWRNHVSGASIMIALVSLVYIL